MNQLQPYVVGLVIYPGMTALDIVGPQTVFSSLPGIKIHRVWKAIEPIVADDGMVIVPDTTFADCPSLDVLCIGGGLKQQEVENDPQVQAFLKQQGDRAQFVTSVCGGSIFLAKAGLLQGYRAATHWAMRGELAKLGVEVGTERVVVDRNRISGGGVTAGIDFALTIAAMLRGEEMAKIAQLSIEYDPAPPFNAGSPETAGSELAQKTIAFITGNLGLAVSLPASHL